MRRKSHFQRPSDKIIYTVITVRADEARHDAERMVRRFCKKVKKSGILDEVRERRQFKSNSEKKTEKRRAKKRLIRKANMRSQALLKTRR